MTRPQTCAKCGQEVRYGKREGITGWLHREETDHLPLFGGPLHTPERQAVIEASLAEMAARAKPDKKKDAPEPEEEPEVWDEIPEPERRAYPITVADLPPRSGMLQIANLILGKNKDKVKDWELVNITRSKGPYVGARGQVLSISESTLIRARGPMVDNGRRVAVASWRDGEFDFAYTGILKDRVVTTQPANSMGLKAWIKDSP